ncbi:MAG: hypothetical protein R3C03_21505 [Pirellulaceae bacterium]
MRYQNTKAACATLYATNTVQRTFYLSLMRSVFALVAGVICCNGCSTSKEAPTEQSKANAASANEVVANTATSESSASSTEKVDPYAVPTDKQVIQDVTGEGKDIISVVPSTKNGKKSWSPTFSQYFWERGLTIKKKVTRFGDANDIVCNIGGFARYEITDGRYNYREFKTLWVEYEGFPRPTDDEILAFAKENMEGFLRGHAARIVHPDDVKIQMAPADEQKYTWHNPNSMSVNLVVECDKIRSNTTLASVRQLFEIRMYRDSPDGKWLRLIGSTDSTKETELSTQELPAEEIREMETLSQRFRAQGKQ